MTIKAPFNFVPLSEYVFSPDWADLISQDIPFKDGLSGEIELNITAQTPIFVRNGHTKEDTTDKTNVYTTFSKAPDGRFFIPATTIKGCIRNILEIMSFGKMRLDINARFAQREWENEKLYPIKTEQSSMCCGWLKLDEKKGEYYILKSKKLYRINHKRINELFDITALNIFDRNNHSIDINKETTIGEKAYDPKTAVYKYKLLESHGIDDKRLQHLPFCKDSDYAVKHKENRVNKAKVEDAEFFGTIVMTGQPDKANWETPRNLEDGKFYEFVFDDKVVEKYIIPEETIEKYKYIYYGSPDWDFHKHKMNSTGIPVFFRLKNNKVKDFGLTFLYKLPYEKTPYETLGNRHKSTDFDLADCIFGSVNGQSPLKGRVQFSNAFSSNAKPSDKYRLALGSPKASYYPLYIRQSGNNGITPCYKTYNDGTISGWKRYLVRANAFERSTGEDTIDTIIYPLAPQTKFSCKVRFHNLLEEELGALLSAITFHNTKECYHQIGQGKPYGFGKVNIQVTQFAAYTSDGEKRTDIIQPMMYFEGLMYESIKGSWVDHDRIVQLFTMAHTEVTTDDVMDYMHMSVDDQNNEFKKAKKEREYLNVYTQLSNTRYSPISLYESNRDRILAENVNVTEKRKNEEYYRMLSSIDIDSINTMEDYDRAIVVIEQARKLYEEIKDGCEDCHSDLFNKLSSKRLKINSSIGLSVLQNRNLRDEYFFKTFKDISNKIEQTKKKCKWDSIPEQEFPQILTAIKRIYHTLKEKDKKEWNRKDSAIWKKIELWVGEGFASEWYNDIINHKPEESC